MAKIDRSMSMASRLAAATALTGTLAACDGRLGAATDGLFTPLPSGSATEAVLNSAPPAEPGNPIYIDGSRAVNDALYQQAYGAPLQGSGQSLPAPQSFANSVYQDQTIAASPILNIPGGPVIDAGAFSPMPVETVAYSQPVLTTPAFEAPVAQYTAPVSAIPSQTFPAITAVPVETVMPVVTAAPVITAAPMMIEAAPTLAPAPVYNAAPAYTPQSNLLPTQVFTDASATEGPRDIESLLDGMPGDSAQYGSSASHRYSVAEEPLPSLASLPEYTPQQYSIPAPMIEADPIVQSFVQTQTLPPIETETVEVAALSGTFAPMPRARPARLGPVLEVTKEVVTARAPLPTARPKMLTTPVPKRRPVQLAALSGRAITDAPALTEPPMMIEVDPVFLDDPTYTNAIADTAPAIETAALAPVDTPEEPVSDAPAMAGFKPEEAETEVAALPPVETVETMASPNVVMDSDIGDLKELSGTSWRLSSLEGTAVPASAELHFDGGSGFAGGQGICNNYGGEFSESLKGEFEMNNIFSTETQCEHFALEKKYIATLETASSYRMAPGLRELMLVGPGGKIIATFVAF